MANAIKDNKCFHDVAQFRDSITFDSLGHGETKSDFVYFNRENADVIPTAFASLASLHPNVVGGLEDLIDVRVVCLDDNVSVADRDTCIFVYVTNNSDTYDATNVIVNIAAI